MKNHINFRFVEVEDIAGGREYIVLRVSGRSTIAPLVGRPSDLWSVDQRGFERSTRGAYNDRPQNSKEKVKNISPKFSYCHRLPYVRHHAFPLLPQTEKAIRSKTQSVLSKER